MRGAPLVPERVRVDLHTHTHRSFDCLTAPSAYLAALRRRGVDRAFVTDHNALDVALEMQVRAPGVIFAGEEIRTREGFDLIGLLLKEEIPKGTPAREAAERIRDQGGVVYLPHPFDGPRSGSGEIGSAAIADLVDVVEVHNARCFLPSMNRRALEWARTHGKLMGAGSDAHTAGEIGNGLVEVPPFEPTRESLLAALADGAIVGTTRASPLVRLASTYAKLHRVVARRLPISPRAP